MRLLPLVSIFLLLGGCLGPLELPTFPSDDDDSGFPDDDDTVDDDDSGQPDDDDVVDDDDSGTPDDDDAVDDDDTTPLEPGGLGRVCASAGTGSDGVYSVTTCTGPVEVAPGVMSNDVYTVRINKLNTIAQ